MYTIVEHKAMAGKEVVRVASEPRTEPHTLESVHASLTGAAAPDTTELRPEVQAGEVNGSSGEEGTAEEEAQLEQERLELELELVETEAALRTMTQDQHAQLAHLEDMRALFKTELAELRDTSWKREAFDALERFKQQLVLDEAAVDGSSAGAEVETTVVGSVGLEGAMVGRAEVDESEALLDELDAEMAAIEKQLNDARALRDEMAGKKLALQAEMDEFLAMELAEARGRSAQ